MSVHRALRVLVRDATGAAGPDLRDRLSASRAVNVAGPENPDVSLCAIADGSLAPDLAVIVVGARVGLLAATRREAYLMMLLGIRPAAFAIVEPATELDDERYHEVTRACTDLARRIGLAPVVCFPVSPRQVKSAGLSLPEFLDQLAVTGPARGQHRGPELPETDRIRATIVWTHARPLPGRHPYLLRIGTRELTARVAGVEHRVDLDTLRPVPATQLQRGQIGDCDLELSASIPAAAYLRAAGGAGSSCLIRAAMSRWPGPGPRCAAPGPEPGDKVAEFAGRRSCRAARTGPVRGMADRTV